ncbi:MAG: sulfatase-like hydrolase/transferase, partial [Gloeobacteraceae cyanobacterium ES-bin-144]|nr:sulfatase-like hydrolase/transferase [Verrucomicrobiales bacterium]
MLARILCSLFFTCNVGNSIAADKQPNVVIILTDDMGYADIDSYGATAYKTPNLDRMAAEGRKFTQWYVSQPVCSASRAGLLTGCYSNRFGINGALMPSSRIGLNPDETTLADLLKSNGYSTAILGK